MKKVKVKKVITVTINEDVHEKLKNISNEVLGSVNVSGFITYIVHNWDRFKDKD